MLTCALVWLQTETRCTARARTVSPWESLIEACDQASVSEGTAGCDVADGESETCVQIRCMHDISSFATKWLNVVNRVEKRAAAHAQSDHDQIVLTAL